MALSDTRLASDGHFAPLHQSGSYTFSVEVEGTNVQGRLVCLCFENLHF